MLEPVRLDSGDLTASKFDRSMMIVLCFSSYPLGAREALMLVPSDAPPTISSTVLARLINLPSSGLTAAIGAVESAMTRHVPGFVAVYQAPVWSQRDPGCVRQSRVDPSQVERQLRGHTLASHLLDQIGVFARVFINAEGSRQGQKKPVSAVQRRTTAVRCHYRHLHA